MDEGLLKDKLSSCSNGPFKKSDFVIAHRGAPLQFPEHSRESYMAAAREGAGTIECDVTFTKDHRLVCRHSQCDLHTTTNILEIPGLAEQCSTMFTPYNPETGTPATAECCTSDITLADFKTLCAKMDRTINPNATALEDFLHTPDFRTDLYATCGTTMMHQESIALIDSYGLSFTPEAKKFVANPSNYTREQFAQAIINDYKEVGINPNRVWPQSFLLEDITYWLEAEPEFAKQAIFLDESMSTTEGYSNATASLAGLAASGIKYIAPPFFALTKLDEHKQIVPSEYAIAAKKAGLGIVGWSFERSGFLKYGGGFYYQFIKDVIRKDSDMYTVLDVLVQQVGISKMFSDWPATVTYYANCMGI
jgi:glycerophosphoryl diester phosphodiesterase